jgi:hypothetical protein
MAEAGGGEGGAPAWLFSFVDLAFLMLIAMTMFAHQNAGAPDLGEMVVPRIGTETGIELNASRGEVWQLRVHPPVEAVDGSLEPPFELVVAGGKADSTDSDVDSAAGSQGADFDRIDRAELQERLAVLEADVGTKPLLAPHEDSRSQDLLDAASLIEDLWPTQRRAVIAKRIDP